MTLSPLRLSVLSGSPYQSFVTLSNIPQDDLILIKKFTKLKSKNDFPKNNNLLPFPCNLCIPWLILSVKFVSEYLSFP